MTVPEVNEAARRALVEEIIASAQPAERLRQALEELDARQDLATQAAVYDSVVWRVDVRHYWVFFRISRVFADLGRLEAGFYAAAQAVQMNPDWPASEQPFRDMFHFLAQKGEARLALDVFLRQVGLFPEKPIAQRHEIEPLLRAVGIEPGTSPGASAVPGTISKLPADPALPPQTPQQTLAAAAPPWPAAPVTLRRDHRVVETELRPPSAVTAVGGAVPFALRALSGPLRRAAIDIAELANGELLVCNDAVVVRDAAGTIQADLSVAGYPDLISRKVLDPESRATVEQHTVDEAVLILDAFPPPNLGHFLLDQVSRLELYRRAGADLAAALVVGPALRAEYQRDIAERAGMRHVLGTDRVARVRARRLWVSSDCRELQHPAHLAAGWAIEHARTVLDGRGTRGHRRLYLSRSDVRARQIENEAELFAVLADHGFESIAPGSMPYGVQLATFREASHIVSAHGAALAHIVLCPPGARVLELFHPLYGTWAYAMLAIGCGLDYRAHVGSDGLSDAPELNEPERIDLAAGRFGERNLRADPNALRLWLAEEP
jgi:capsular polysaccharide biosynthesis protein